MPSSSDSPLPTGAPSPTPDHKGMGAEPTPTAGSELAITTPELASRSHRRPTLDHVGLHEILGELSRGGMGVVYRARHIVLDRVVALKMMRTDVRLWPEDGQRFEREMRAVARLRHPNILPIYEIGWHDGQPFYTMPYLAGGSLSEHRPRLRGEPRVAVQLISKVARAVQHAHEQGIVHRDLKPGNVLLDEANEPLVADFGLAKIQDDVDLTQTGAVLGTAPYMAPEQAAGRSRQVGPWTDVWSLGVMLYELLTGHRPFVGDSNEEIKERIQRATPRRPRTLEARLDKRLERIILKCLRKEPACRYPTASELADDLDRYLRGERPQVCGEVWSSQLRSAVRNHYAWLIFVTLALAALVSLTVFGLTTLSSPRPARPSPLNLPSPIILIDERTAPAELRWRPGKEGATLLASPPRAELSLRSENLHLLELRAEPPWPRYRLEAVIRHENGRRNSGAGIFVALARHTFAKGPCYSYWQLGFAEHGDEAGKVELRVTCLKDSPPYAVIGLPCDDRPPHTFLPDRRGNGASPWRPLALEVDDDEVRAFWGETCIQKVPRERMERLNARILLGLGNAKGDPSPQNSLGVYSFDGSASFQQVNLKPFP